MDVELKSLTTVTSLTGFALDPDVRAGLDQAAITAGTHKDAWAQLSPSERINLIDEIHERLQAVDERWARASIEGKGVPPASWGAASEWYQTGMFYRLLRVLRGALADTKAWGRPHIPGPVTTRPDGQAVARVFPQNWQDRLLFQGLTVDVWMVPGAEADEIVPAQADRGMTELILAAGNTSILVPLDILSKLFVDNATVVVKMHPVNEYLGPLVEEIFSPLIRRGYMQVVYGGAAEGAYLCQHPAIDGIHVTGSANTYEAIVYGPGPEGARRKAENAPIITKPVTAELGNVTPMIVVPGPWTDADLRATLNHFAGHLMDNAGFNCLTPRVIVQDKSWPQRQHFVDTLAGILAEQPTRLAYYPGARERHEAFLAEHPDARLLGQPDEGHLPWTLIEGVDPNCTGDICFCSESFCSLWSETALAADNVPDFIDRAVALANDTLWGNLVAVLLVHPASLQDPATAAAVERAIADLRFGSIVVNGWSALALMFAVNPWGAYPGNRPGDIQSGIGSVGNFLRFRWPQKTVVRARFHKSPDPLAITMRDPATFARRMMEYEARPTPLRMLRVIAHVLRG